MYKRKNMGVSKYTAFAFFICMGCLCLIRGEKKQGSTYFLQNLTIPTNAVYKDGKSNTFAVPEYVDIDIKHSGDWFFDTKSKEYTWSIDFISYASSLNFGFSEFILPPSAKLEICSSKGNTCLEFDHDPNRDHHLEWWSPILKGGHARMELAIAAADLDYVRLKIDVVNKGLVRKNALSQECLIDVVCDAEFEKIQDFEAQIQSVGLITIEGTRICSGVLVNNVRQDFTPYFLTARHCGINAENAPSVVVHWNFNNSTCRFDTPENKLEGDGSLETFNSGATFLADLQRSDFTLLLLDSPVIPEANAYFAGWNASSEAPQDVTTIHHANTEEKRISFGEGPTEITRHFGMEADLDLDHIRVLEWAISSTAPGSSGGPLFDKEKRVVGQLHGGLAACDNKESDWYGRLHTSWEGDGTPDRQLKYWLDPDNSDIEVLNGIWNEGPPLELTIEIDILQEVACNGADNGTIQIRTTNGQAPFQFSIDGGQTYQQSSLFKNLSAGNYTILVKDVEENASPLIDFVLSEPDPITLSYTQLYNQIQLSVSGGLAPYIFTMDNMVTQDSIFLMVNPGLQTFIVTDANGCNEELLIDINFEPFVASINMIQDISCFGEQDGSIVVMHSASVEPYMYRLSGTTSFQSSNRFDGLEAGAYFVTVRDSLGNETNSDTIQITEPDLLAAELSIVEETIEIIAMGGQTPYLYSLDEQGFSPNNTFSVSDSVRFITIQDANGCSIEISNIFSNSQDLTEQDEEYGLFPNPARDVINIRSLNRDITEIYFIDAQGRRLHMEIPQEGQKTIQVFIGRLDPGLYFVEIIDRKGKRSMEKMIKMAQGQAF